MPAAKQSSERGAALARACKNADLPLSAALLSGDSPDLLGPHDSRSMPISMLLAAEDSARSAGAMQLATGLAAAAAQLVCGADLCSAHSSVHLPQMLKRLAPAADSSVREPLQPVLGGSVRKQGSRGAKQRTAKAHAPETVPVPDTAVAWGEARLQKGHLLQPLRDAAEASSGAPMRSAVGPGAAAALQELSMQLHAAAVECAVADVSGPNQLMELPSANAILAALDLPPPPLFQTPEHSAPTARKGRRGKAACARSEYPFFCWAGQVLASTSRAGMAAVASRLLFSVASASASAAGVQVALDHADRLLAPTTDADMAVLGDIAGTFAVAAHAGLTVVGLQCAAQHRLAALAALAAAPALAFGMLQQSVSVANVHAMLLLPLLAAGAAAGTAVNHDRGVSAATRTADCTVPTPSTTARALVQRWMHALSQDAGILSSVVSVPDKGDCFPIWLAAPSYLPCSEEPVLLASPTSFTCDVHLCGSTC